MLVAILVIGVIAGAVIVNFGSLLGDRELGEGALRVEGVLRLARAEALSTGRRVRLEVETDSGLYRVTWEPDPLKDPGKFVDCPASWASRLPTDAVLVKACEGGDPPEPVSGKSDEAPAGAMVTFEPDGSSESVRLDVASARHDDGRRVRVELDGVSGAVWTHELESSEMETSQ